MPWEFLKDLPALTDTATAENEALLDSLHAGHAHAATKLALRCQERGGTPAQVFEWLLVAAARGDPAAAELVALAFFEGSAVTRDPAGARRWLAFAAGRGNDAAANRLGIACERGEGGPQDFAEAAAWYARATAAGNGHAALNLARMYAYGRGVRPSPATAYLLTLIACAAGVEDAAELRDRLAAILPGDTATRVQARAAAWRPVAH